MPAKPAAADSKAGEAKVHEAARIENRQVNGKAADVKKAATAPSKKPAEPPRHGSAAEKHHESRKRPEPHREGREIWRGRPKSEKSKKAEKPKNAPPSPPRPTR